MAVSKQLWHKWTETIKTHWELSNNIGEFWQGIALVICQTPFHNHPKVKERNKMVVSMTVAYVLESWTLSSFAEMAFMLENLKDAQGIISLTRLHKEAKFYPDVYFADHSKHITLAHLDKLGMCRAAKNFTTSVLH